MARDKTRCLITGVSGLLGSNLAHYFTDTCEILGLYHRHPVRIDGIFTEGCDLTDPASIARIVSEFSPHHLIHCASMTDIDECETNKAQTHTVNVIGTRHVVRSIMERDTKLVYISTDAVYDGVEGGFSETDAVHPQNHYGRTKYEGELEVLKKSGALILRTNMFGWNIQDKQSLGEWIVESLKNRKKINGFTDAYFSSIYTMELARVIEICIQKNATGVFNCGSASRCSKYDFAVKIAALFGLDPCLIRPISIEESELKAKRGKNLALNSDRLQKALRYRLPTIDYCAESFYRDAQCGKAEKIKQNPEPQVPVPLINYGRHWIREDDIRAVARVLRTGPITQGPKVQAFEEALENYCDAGYAVAVNSGTSGLHIACMAAGLKAGDEGITSPITFVASANCMVYCGVTPVFADIDPNTYNISPTAIEKKITDRTRVVIPVHFAGQSCDMAAISRIVKDAENRFGHKIYIIEDASHALGSEYNGSKVGACAFSDMTVMSFHPVKHITTAEGGVVLTQDERLYQLIRRFRSHGITSSPEEFVYRNAAFENPDLGVQAPKNPWYYEQIDLGYNYRITDIQCTLGVSQIEKIAYFKKRRRSIVERYNTAFEGFDAITRPFEAPGCHSNFHLYVLLFDFEKLGLTRARFMTELKRHGIQTQVHYIPVHTQPYFQRHYQTGWGDCPAAERYYSQCLSIPLYPAMTDADVEQVIDRIRRLARVASAYS